MIDHCYRKYGNKEQYSEMTYCMARKLYMEFYGWDVRLNKLANISCPHLNSLSYYLLLFSVLLYIFPSSQITRQVF